MESALWNKLIVWPRGQVTSTHRISSCRFNELDTGGETTSTKSNLRLFVSEPGSLIPLGYLHHHLDGSAFLPLGPPLRGWPTSFLVLTDSSCPGIFLLFVRKSPSRPGSKSDVPSHNFYTLSLYLWKHCWCWHRQCLDIHTNPGGFIFKPVYFAVDQKTQNT